MVRYYDVPLNFNALQESRLGWMANTANPLGKSTDVEHSSQGTGEEGALGKLTGHKHPPPPLIGCAVFLRHCWLPKNKGKEENKWLTDRDHSPAGPKSPSPLQSDVGNKGRRKWQIELIFL